MCPANSTIDSKACKKKIKINAANQKIGLLRCTRQREQLGCPSRFLENKNSETPFRLQGNAPVCIQNA